MTIPNLFLPVLAALMVLFVPGGALLAWQPESSKRDPLALLADAAALSVALTALVGLYLFLPGIRLGGAAVGVIFAALLAVCVLGLRRRGITLPSDWAGGLLAGLVVLAMVAYRLFQARGLSLPAWVDSVHHTLIVRAMLEYGGIPPDLSPYLPVTFYYHYGFHSITALFAFWARLQPGQAVLWFGQVLNAGVALSVYRLGVTLACGEDERRTVVLRALVAALLTGFVFHMPAYYLTWGRYTLLAGLLLAGPAMAAAYEFWHDFKNLAAGARFVLLLAGLFLTHYLVVLLVGIFLLVLGLIDLIPAVRRNVELPDWQRFARSLPWGLIAASLLALALALPWVARIGTYSIYEVNFTLKLPDQVDGLGGLFESSQWNYLIYLLGPRRNHILMGLAAVGMLFALRRPALRPLVGWTAAILLLALPWGVQIGPFRPDLYIIVLFFPASILLGDMLVSSAEALGNMYRPVVGLAVLALVVGGLLAWGVRETKDIVNATTVFVTPGDVMALDWVYENTPPDARFFINVAGWQYTTFRGVDGGYWLMPYTGRGSLVPPAVYGYGTPDDYWRITGWARRAQELHTCSADFWELVDDARLSHVYVRLGQGNLQPQGLQDCPGLQQVYSSGGVLIYQVDGKLHQDADP